MSTAQLTLALKSSDTCHTLGRSYLKQNRFFARFDLSFINCEKNIWSVYKFEYFGEF